MPPNLLQDQTTPQLARQALFGLLAQPTDGAAGVSVLTPNRRLAQALQTDIDHWQSARGLQAWEAADILPPEAWLTRWHAQFTQQASLSDLPMPPGVLRPEQEQWLWEQVIADSRAGEGLLVPGQAAAQCRDAWNQVHAWGMLPALMTVEGNPDAQAFWHWSRAYDDRCNQLGLIDQARLPDRIADWLRLQQAAAETRPVSLPHTLVLYAFDLLSQQWSDLLRTLQQCGVRVVCCQPPALSVSEGGLQSQHCLAFADAAAERLAAARWARALLERQPQARIAIVVPDLQQQRSAMLRVLWQVCAPGRSPLDASAAQFHPPFNLSLGQPLSAWPLVQAAFSLLSLLSDAELPFAQISQLLRSPFLLAAEREAQARARLDAALRSRLPATPTLALLRQAMAHAGAGEVCPELDRCLAQLSEFAHTQSELRHTPSQWVALIEQMLCDAGFPGERALDSSEYQTARRLRELIAGLSVFDALTTKGPGGQPTAWSFETALQRLRRMAADTLFQPQVVQAPIQVLGVLESAGLQFDALWVMGLTAEAWPMPSRPNPFLPLSLQRSHGVPQSSPELALALDRRITRGWMDSAPQRVFSYAMRSDDRELAPSALIEGWPPLQDSGQTTGQTTRQDSGQVSAQHSAAAPAALAGVVGHPLWHEILQAAAAIEQVAESRVPLLPSVAESPSEPVTSQALPTGGGTRLFLDQSECAFRAFAAHRLHVRPLEMPSESLDGRDRGSLLHTMMEILWLDLKDSQSLQAAIGADGLQALLERAAAQAVQRWRGRRPQALGEREAALQQQRLVQLVGPWLQLEAERADFKVQSAERGQTLQAGGIAVQGRPDRIDHTAQGDLVIDYKTGTAGSSDWIGRSVEVAPKDLQLPLYALANPAVSGLAVARIKAGELRFIGLARDSGVLPKVHKVQSVTESKRLKGLGIESWEALREYWHRHATALGAAFAAGTAEVQPRHMPQSCRYCGMQSLCRIAERAGWDGLAPEEGADDGSDESGSDQSGGDSDA